MTFFLGPHFWRVRWHHGYNIEFVSACVILEKFDFRRSFLKHSLQVLYFFACIEMDHPVEMVTEPLRSDVPGYSILLFHQYVDLICIERVVVKHLLLHSTCLLSHSARKISSVKHCGEFIRIRLCRSTTQKQMRCYWSSLKSKHDVCNRYLCICRDNKYILDAIVCSLLNYTRLVVCIIAPPLTLTTQRLWDLHNAACWRVEKREINIMSSSRKYASNTTTTKGMAAGPLVMQFIYSCLKYINMRYCLLCCTLSVEVIIK